jgi:hypothetical protein
VANPTGSNLTENTGYVWQDGDVYQIAQADTAEGAATGASFGGLGVDNQPHQTLLNKVKFVKGRQDNNIASIAALQNFAAAFVSSLKTNGYLKIPLTDVSRGPVIAVIQWGYYVLAQQNVVADTQLVVTWPIPFPNAILLPPLATNVYYQTTGGNTVASVISWGTTGATFVLDVPGNLTGIQNPQWKGEQTNGFSWLAIGF